MDQVQGRPDRPVTRVTFDNMSLFHRISLYCVVRLLGEVA